MLKYDARPRSKYRCEYDDIVSRVPVFAKRPRIESVTAHDAAASASPAIGLNECVLMVLTLSVFDRRVLRALPVLMLVRSINAHVQHATISVTLLGSAMANTGSHQNRLNLMVMRAGTRRSPY